MTPYLLLLLGSGLLVLLVSWLPLALRRLPVSLAIVCVAVGAGLFSTGWFGLSIDPLRPDRVIERLTETVVIVALMGAGLKLNRRIGLRRWATTWRLLLVAMPLTIIAATFAALHGFGFSLATALLFAAALAPTDPVLASEVQVTAPRDREDAEVRVALTSEAGLNDGLAFPFVHLSLAFAAAQAVAPGAWPEASALGKWLLMDVVWRVIAGAGVGWLLGRALGWLTFDMPRAKLSGTGDGLVALGATLVAYALAETVHGYGFLAVFITALALRDHERNHEYHEALHDFSEQVERLMMMLVLVLFGGAIATGLFAPLTWLDLLVALVLVLVVRPAAAWVSMIGSKAPRHDRWLIAFFGVRGIGSFYYVAYGLTHASFESGERLWAVTGLVVGLSILLHGVTATPLMRRFDQQRRTT